MFSEPLQVDYSSSSLPVVDQVNAELAGEVCGACALVCCGHGPGVNADSQPAASDRQVLARIG